MLRHGIKAMTMDELARHMGISKRTIYENFQDKNTLLIAIFQHYKKEHAVKFEKILEESPTVLHAAYRWNNERSVSMPLAKVISLYDEVKRYHPVVYQKEILKDIDQRFEETKGVLELGVKQGVFRKDLDVEVATSLMISLSQQMAEDTDGYRRQFSIEKLHATYMEIFIRGCCSVKGYQLFDQIFLQETK